jgi:hypothetical protein
MACNSPNCKEVKAAHEAVMQQSHTSETKHLLYHCYPVRPSGECWRWNLAQIKKRESLFDGLKIVCVAQDGMAEDVSVVQKFLGSNFIVVGRRNDITIAEVQTWWFGWSQYLLHNSGRVFYAHAKGVSHPWKTGSPIARWTNLMYETCLDYWPIAERLLNEHPVAGSFCLKGQCFPSSRFFYSGAFFWTNIDAARDTWAIIDHQRWGVEAWPGRHFPNPGVIFSESPIKNGRHIILYDHRHIFEQEKKALEWRELNQNEKIDFAVQQSSDKPMRPSAPLPPCVELGHAKGSQQLIQLGLDPLKCGCGGKVRACGIHDNCTTETPFKDFACCATCMDYDDGNGKDPDLATEPICNETKAKTNATVHRHRAALYRQLRAPAPKYTGPDDGCGLILAGGGRYWPGTVIAAKMWRKFTNLPIEIWKYLPGQDHNPKDLEGVEGITYRDAAEFEPRRMTLFEIKALALQHAKFRYAFWLDSDGWPTADPSPLFELLKKYSFLYWRDIAEYKVRAKWEMVGVDGSERIPHVQAGHLLFDRKACWKELSIIHWMNQHSDFYYWPHISGDHDQSLWRVIWTATQNSWRCLGNAVWKYPAFSCKFKGQTMCVHRCAGDAKIMAGNKRLMPGIHPYEKEAWAIFDEVTK